MIATVPAVQFNIKRWHHVCIILTPAQLRYAKRNANRRHRRALNRVTYRIQRDPELWWDEGFNAPTLSDYDLW